MAWELTTDLDSFTAAAGDFLRSRPVSNTTLLTLVSTLRQRGLQTYGSEPPIFGTWLDPYAMVAGALLQTPPHPVYFSAMPPAAVSAAVRLLDGRPLPGVNLRADAVAGFAEPWRARTGVTATVRMRVRLYRLETLVAPVAPGLARPAGLADRAHLITWLTEFHEYIGESAADVPGLIDVKLAAGLITLWEADGEPVSMVVRSAPEAGVVRIQNVYTPAARRGRGYAGGATARAAQEARDAGADEVVLFTDLSNPTSNALYQRLGFRPIEDRTVVAFAGRCCR
jgi:ribosomal protein S18 acetylase RimI-like enzyme